LAWKKMVSGEEMSLLSRQKKKYGGSGGNGAEAERPSPAGV
jgi:hypothetical protein